MWVSSSSSTTWRKSMRSGTWQLRERRVLLMKTPSETHTLLAQHVPSDAQPEVKIAIAASRRPWCKQAQSTRSNPHDGLLITLSASDCYCCFLPPRRELGAKKPAKSMNLLVHWHVRELTSHKKLLWEKGGKGVVSKLQTRQLFVNFCHLGWRLLLLNHLIF